jgi:hypothetical protein
MPQRLDFQNKELSQTARSCLCEALCLCPATFERSSLRSSQLQEEKDWNLCSDINLFSEAKWGDAAASLPAIGDGSTFKLSAASLPSSCCQLLAHLYSSSLAFFSSSLVATVRRRRSLGPH